MKINYRILISTLQFYFPSDTKRLKYLLSIRLEIQIFFLIDLEMAHLKIINNYIIAYVRDNFLVFVNVIIV